MLRLLSRTSLLVLASTLVLAGCGSKTQNNATTTSGAVYGPATPAATAVGNATDAELPSASDTVGTKPVVTFPTTPPPPAVQRKMLHQGDGAEVKAGDLLVTNYYGIVWGATTPFDNSYDKKKVSSFKIGVGQVVSGWDVALVGVKTGSRVLLTLSPSDGYGLAGKTDAGIKGTDTLVFVIDVLAALSTDQLGQADAAVQPAPANSPVVAGAPGTIPTLTIPAGLAEPTAQKLDVLAKGTGAPITEGTIYIQYGVWDWTAVLQGSTWPSEMAQDVGPVEVELTADVTQLAGLVGVPVGSRVLLQLPGDEENQQPASVFVLDVLYEAPPVA